MLAAALVAMMVAALCVGCGSTEGSSGANDPSDSDNGSLFVDEEEDVDGEAAMPAGADTIYMCGRSVLGEWFDHWGWDYDPEDPVLMDGYSLVYVEMDVPPGIVDTAREAAREAADGGGQVMFFKLCFDDFEGGDEDAARDNLARNMRIAGEVVEAAVDEEGLILILGNALPKVREYTDEWLVWNQREYNRLLQELADASGGRIVVLDLYGTLAASGGWLEPGYAADPYDSHLNDAAYEALDVVLSDVLAGLPGGG
jgi:hypothetical protein